MQATQSHASAHCLGAVLLQQKLEEESWLRIKTDFREEKRSDERKTIPEGPRPALEHSLVGEAATELVSGSEPKRKKRSLRRLILKDPDWAWMYKDVNPELASEGSLPDMVLFSMILREIRSSKEGKRNEKKRRVIQSSEAREVAERGRESACDQVVRQIPTEPRQLSPSIQKEWEIAYKRVRAVKPAQLSGS